jgi:hypothetical protein
MTKQQQITFDLLISQGATYFPEDGLPNVVLFLGRWLLINQDGTYEDL